MKKLILSLAVIITLFVQKTNAQMSGSSKLYFKVGTGFNVATSNAQHGYGETPISVLNLPFYNATDDSGGDVQWEIVDVNLGKGLNVGATVGYMFSSHFGAELEVNYLMGSKTEAKMVLNSSFTHQTQTLSSTMIQIKPTFVMSAGYSKINPYTKFGLIIGSGKIIHGIEVINEINSPDIEENIRGKSDVNSGRNLTKRKVSGEISSKMDVNSESDLFELEGEAKGGIAFGFHAGVGLTFKLTSQLYLFSELNITSLGYSPKEGKITKYNENGVDQLGTLDRFEREYEYTEQNPFLPLYNGSTTPEDQDQPTKAPKTTYNYSTLGITVGLKYSL